MATIAENLQSLVTAKNDIATAIEDKGVTVPEDAGFRNFPDLIESIITTTGDQPCARFIDYDGTIVETYTKSEFMNLSSLPTNPSHDGLTAQGWNWTLSDAKTYMLTNNANIDIGQSYITSDGKTRIYFYIQDRSLFHPWLHIYLDPYTTVNIDWGDDSAQSTATTTGSGNLFYEQHSYSSVKRYIITIEVVEGSIRFQSKSASLCTLLSKDPDPTYTSMNGAPSAYQNSIEKIEFGDNVTIDQYALVNCSKLSAVAIPNSIANIGQCAFSKCSNLSSITLPDTITTIGSYAFNGCYSLIHISLPNNSVTSIGDYVFAECRNLLYVAIPTSLTSVNSYAFSKCSNLSSITLPDTLTTIDSYAFYYCHSLSSVTLPDTLTKIGDHAFYSCYSLKDIILPNSITSIGTYSFSYCISATSLYISNKITTIPSHAFDNCTSLTSTIAIPHGVTLIDSYAFYHCESIECVNLGIYTLGKIGSYAFSGCFNLSSIIVSSSGNLATIDSYSFQYCPSLYSVTIPKYVSRINGNAFSNCVGLTSIEFKGSKPPTIQYSNVFTNLPTSCIIRVPSGSLSAYTSASNYPNPSTYTYEEY